MTGDELLALPPSPWVVWNSYSHGPTLVVLCAVILRTEAPLVPECEIEIPGEHHHWKTPGASIVRLATKAEVAVALLLA